MTVKIEKFVRKPFFIDAVQVTADNVEAVATWCQGEVRKFKDSKGKVTDEYVKVRVHRPLNERQTKAYVGDWVLYAGSGFKVYTVKAFNSSFEMCGIDEKQKLVELSEGQSVQMTPAHVLLEEIFVTAEQA